MRILKISCLFLFLTLTIFLNGCGPSAADLKIQNDTQRQRLAELESKLQATKLKLEQAQRKVDSAGSVVGAQADALRQKIAALEEDIGKKVALISAMQQQLLHGGAELPVELSTMLEDFAGAEKMVTYDPSRGVIKFMSDLLFESGSDEVMPAAANAVKLLCKILNTEQGQKFDVIVAGHTDDMRIGRAETRQKHPTNWHLSAHRAISVLRVMQKSGIDLKRMSVRGFGEYRPLEPNKANKRGNPKNRRVEIYIVAKGV